MYRFTVFTAFMLGLCIPAYPESTDVLFGDSWIEMESGGYWGGLLVFVTRDCGALDRRGGRRRAGAKQFIVVLLGESWLASRAMELGADCRDWGDLARHVTCDRGADS
jgi:hypothetical protein